MPIRRSVFFSKMSVGGLLFIFYDGRDVISSVAGRSGRGEWRKDAARCDRRPQAAMKAVEGLCGSTDVTEKFCPEPIRSDAAHAKEYLFAKCGVRQHTWDSAKRRGMPVTEVGLRSWVLGSDFIEACKTAPGSAD